MQRIFRHLLLATLLVHLGIASATAQADPLLTHSKTTVSRAVFSNDGTLLAIASHEAAIELWDVRSRKLVRTLDSAIGDYDFVSFLSGGASFAAWNQNDDFIAIWDVKSGKKLATFRTHCSPFDLATSLRGDLLALERPRLANGKKGTLLRIQSVPKGDVLVRIPIVTKEGEDFGRWTFSPQGKLVAIASDRSTRICNAISGKVSRSLPVGEASGEYDSLLFSPNGKLIARLGERGVDVWNLETKRRILSTPSKVYVFQHAAFSACGGSFYVVCDRSPGLKVRSWNTKTGEERPELPIHLNSKSDCLAISRDAEHIALVDSDTRTDLFLMKLVHTVEPRWTTKVKMTSRFGFAFSPDGKSAAAAVGREVLILDKETGALQRRIPRHNDVIEHLAYSSDGNMLATACQDGYVRIWDPRTTKLLKTLRHSTKKQFGSAYYTRFSPDGKTLVSCGTEYTLWNIDKATKIGSYGRYLGKGYSSQHPPIAFSPDSQWLALSAKGGISLRNTNSGIAEISYPGQSYFLVFSPDGKYLASSVGKGQVQGIGGIGQVSLFPIEGGPKPKFGQTASQVIFSNDGKILVGSTVDEGVVEIWDVKNSRLRRRIEASSRSVHDFAVSPNGKWLATAGDDGIIKLWDMDTGNELTGLTMRQPGVHFVTFSPDSRRVAAVTKDAGGIHNGEVKVWDVTVFDSP